MDVFFAHVDLVSGFINTYVHYFSCPWMMIPIETCVPHGLSMGAAEAFSAVSFKICHAPV